MELPGAMLDEAIRHFRDRVGDLEYIVEDNASCPSSDLPIEVIILARLAYLHTSVTTWDVQK